jgi:hypothetical protein
MYSAIETVCPGDSLYFVSPSSFSGMAAAVNYVVLLHLAESALPIGMRHMAACYRLMMPGFLTLGRFSGPCFPLG